MSDPSTPENPTPDGNPVDGAAPTASPADAASATPAADGAPATPPEAPRYVQPYPGAPPVPTGNAPQSPGAAQLPPYAAAGYPGAPAGASPQAPGQYAPPAGQYAAPGGAYPPAGSGTPSGPDTRPKTLAIIALCLAIAGGIIAFVPFVNLLAAPLLIAAIVLAIIALVSKKQGGTGLSIAALVVSVLSGLAAIIIAVVSIFLVTLGGFGAFDDAPDDTYSEPYTDGNGDDEAVYGADLELEVVETAFGDAGLGDGTWWYAVVIDNPNDDAVFDYEDLTVTALDASGGELQTNDEYLTIMPGTTAVTGYFDALGDAQISALEVDLPGAENGYIVDPAGLGALTVGDVSASTDSSVTTVTGTVTSTLTEDSEYVFVHLLARDASGAIISVATGMADSVPAGGSASFDASFYPALADGVTVEAYAVL